MLKSKIPYKLSYAKIYSWNLFFSKLEAPSVPLELTTEDSSEKLPDKLSRLLAAERLDGLDGPEDRTSVEAPGFLTPLST